jgi:hypothetical protein
MALKKDYSLKIPYRLGLTEPRELYAGVLTPEQMVQLEDVPVKEFAIPNAYHKIESIQGTKENMDFKLYIFNESGDKLLTSENYSFVPSVDDDAANFIKQGYEYLKTLPPFTNAIDC